MTNDQKNADPIHLIVNAGSATVKYAIFEGEQKKIEVLIEICGENVRQTLPSLLAKPDVQKLLHGKKFVAIAFRFVHGGHRYRNHVRLTPKILNDLRSLDELAPLHNPFARALVEESGHLFPSVRKYLMFDTAFHATIPEQNRRYALPTRYGMDSVLHRYGFHGIVCSSIVHQLKTHRRLKGKLIICHLGSGCSVTAVKNGESIDTSMGFTPLEGLLMSTRAGDLDPGLLLYIQKKWKISPRKMECILNFESGLKAICGSSDMREIIKNGKSGNQAAILALEMFCLKAAKVIAAAMVSLGGVDQIVFSGGIGENSPLIRKRILQHLQPLGIRQRRFFSRVNIQVLHADEEEEMNRIIIKLRSATRIPPHMT